MQVGFSMEGRAPPLANYIVSLRHVRAILSHLLVLISTLFVRISEYLLMLRVSSTSLLEFGVCDVKVVHGTTLSLIIIPFIYQDTCALILFLP